MATTGYIHRNFDMRDFLAPIQEGERKAFAVKGMQLKEALRRLVPKDTRALMSAIANPVMFGHGINEGFRIEINKPYANFQDKAVLRHRPNYASSSRQQSSFSALAENTKEQRLAEMQKRYDTLQKRISISASRGRSAAGLQELAARMQKSIETVRSLSSDQYKYGSGYRKALRENMYIREQADYVNKAFVEVFFNNENPFDFMPEI